MDRLLSMRVFQRVVDDGGFAAAARALDMSPATVTRLFGDLEQHLGARLMQRTTRKLAFTEAGEVYLLTGARHPQRDRRCRIRRGHQHAGAAVARCMCWHRRCWRPTFWHPTLRQWRQRTPRWRWRLPSTLTRSRRVDEFDVTFMAVDEEF
jgi:DNA-binding transcriptional LysR family regulator